MRISIDAHAIGQHLTGNEVYVRNLLKQFPRLEPGNEYYAYVAVDSSDPSLRHIPQQITTRQVSANPFKRLGFDLSNRVKQDRPGLLHVQYTAPLTCPAPVITTVHDVSYIEHPEYFSPPRRHQLQYTVERTVRSAAKVIAPSEFSRRSILQRYGLRSDRVVTIPNGVSTAYRPLAREKAREQIARKFGFRFPFLLMVSDIHLRKNQVGLIKAFEELLRSHPQLPHHLVFAGQSSWKADQILRSANRSAVAERVHFTGWVEDDEDVLRLYNACESFIFPSLYEGFGLPVLEAMACGTPVACSNTTAVFEVADSCAVTFDPSSVSSMVRALRDLLLDSELRVRMGRLGLQRASRFTWEQAAEKTLAVYHEVTRTPIPVKIAQEAPVIR